MEAKNILPMRYNLYPGAYGWGWEYEGHGLAAIEQRGIPMARITYPEKMTTFRHEETQIWEQ